MVAQTMKFESLLGLLENGALLSKYTLAVLVSAFPQVLRRLSDILSDSASFYHTNKVPIEVKIQNLLILIYLLGE